MARQMLGVLLFFVAMLLAPTVGAQSKIDSTAAITQFQYFTDGSTLVDAVVVDAQGNSFVAGNTTPAGRSDSQAFVAKISSLGVVLFKVSFGGSKRTFASSIALGSTGKIVIAGSTTSADFPVTATAFQPRLAGDQDGFIAVLSETGAIEYASFVGGSAYDDIGGVAVNGQGDIYVAGQTHSRDFPVTNGALQAGLNGPVDGFILKIRSSGELTYSSYLGGSDGDAAYAIAVDAGGSVVVGGYAGSGFPTTAGAYQPTKGKGSSEGFVVKFDSRDRLVYSTYIGDGPYSVRALAADPGGRVAVTGDAWAGLRTTTNAPQPAFGGYTDIYVVVLDATGAHVDFATYLGGIAVETPYAIKFGPDGSIAVSGFTQSSNFPVTPGAPQTRFVGGPTGIAFNLSNDGFLTVLDASGQLRLSTFLGGAGPDGINGLAWDGAGALVLVGATGGSDFPSPPGAVMSALNGFVGFWARIAAPPANDRRVVEYYNADLGHYFLAADPAEQRFVDSGAVGKWQRTGHVFSASGSQPVCRFYGNAAINPTTGAMYGPNSHFYTATDTECQYLKSLFDPRAKSWKFESNEFLSVAPSSGTCPPGRAPVYRAYNNGFAQGVDSNHRIVANKGAYDAVVAKGWIGEGVVMCASTQ